MGPDEGRLGSPRARAAAVPSRGCGVGPRGPIPRSRGPSDASTSVVDGTDPRAPGDPDPRTTATNGGPLGARRRSGSRPRPPGHHRGSPRAPPDTSAPRHSAPPTSRECVADQAEPASPIRRSRVTHQPEPICHASGGTTQSQSAPGRIRTSDPRIRSPPLCPLSYRRRDGVIGRRRATTLTALNATRGVDRHPDVRLSATLGVAPRGAPHRCLRGGDVGDRDP